MHSSGQCSTNHFLGITNVLWRTLIQSSPENVAYSLVHTLAYYVRLGIFAFDACVLDPKLPEQSLERATNELAFLVMDTVPKTRVTSKPSVLELVLNVFGCLVFNTDELNQVSHRVNTGERIELQGLTSNSKFPGTYHIHCKFLKWTFMQISCRKEAISRTIQLVLLTRVIEKLVAVATEVFVIKLEL